MAIGAASCSDEDGLTESETINKALINMTGSYSGSISLSGNQFRTVRFDVDTAVNIRELPLDGISIALYPHDYESVKNPIVGISARIDSVGNVTNSILPFHAEYQDINYTFTKDEDVHSVYARIDVRGTYNLFSDNITLQLSVTDLLVDGEDKTRLIPLIGVIDSASKEK